MLSFVEAGGRILHITRYPALAYALARNRSRRQLVVAYCPHGGFAFYRGNCLNQ